MGAELLWHHPISSVRRSLYLWSATWPSSITYTYTLYMHLIHAPYTCTLYVHLIYAPNTCTLYMHLILAPNICTLYLHLFGHHSFTVLARGKDFWEMQLFTSQQRSNKFFAMEEKAAFLLVCNTCGWHLYNAIFARHCPKDYFISFP